MSSGLPSDEVAEDYKNSLEDLTTNDKFQISNLTVIAKENTEHAMAISRVLENHIRTTPPSQKLPALYVVDSVVKNVGTPYTLFLGRNLYQTFMNAYTLVDQQTRRKLDEMLKTWKEPVPGSLDPRPVFPVEITRSIENALIKARTAALQQQQRNQPQDVLARSRSSAAPPSWTHTPTPPQGVPYRYPSASHAVNGHPQGHGSESHTPQQGQNVDLPALHRDIENLIGSARADFAASPFDVSIQQRLKALLDLQAILQRQQLPPDQLKLVRDQVSALAPAPKPAATQPFPQSNVPIPNISTPPSQPIPQATPQPNLAALLNPNTLASLLQATANRQQSTPPPAVGGIVPQTQPSGTPQPATAENPLIASLRARGLLPPVPSTATPPTGAPLSLPLLVPGQIGYTPPASVSTPQNMTDITINVHLSTASIKIPRPVLINSLYDAKSNRCGTCGRRFLTTEEGKQKKARHLDWHFRTNQRMTDSIKRGQNRSWYVDERDWIKSREFDDDSGLAGTGPGNGTTSTEEEAAKKQPQKQWIRAPNDVALRNAPCPICQEKFESTWSEDVQDWIWQDALKVGNRVYHASCYAEVTKDGSATAARAGTPLARTGTPDSVLGKRKAEHTESPGSKVRIKTEPV
ncbi:mRNA cleavage factor complex component Pcf11, putative [Talaromyces stipitatus ATCC 10500]|uniref:mRNA cleavage factor complex component Pcf11, putative n=1 Tax=Talaromyces stipitatus (strain ATCC 10500 / CBS 375.48 / QM 6759 / NRRL 1006) TaxID=441959 RepID=B8MLD3_TALSN|nr:mRNA cleavage factor complex component Pcf11, putative [Talaromyces stipitatus ATCC 10500]EED15048.1 mRNA cleavage factor complex component Pcf11, putative [Talaromyces stipitatus ATCC 10500]